MKALFNFISKICSWVSDFISKESSNNITIDLKDSPQSIAVNAQRNSSVNLTINNPQLAPQVSSPNIGRKIEEQSPQSVHSVLPTLSPSDEQVSPAMTDVDEKMYILVLADEAFLGGRHLHRGDVVLAEGDGLQLLLEYKKVRYITEPKVTVGINNESGVMHNGQMLRYKSIHDLPRKDAVELLSQPKPLVCMLDPTSVVLKALKPMKVPGYRYLPGKLFFAPESKALEYEAKGEAKIMGR